MSFLALLISMFVFALVLIAIFWVGIYVVLPVVLFFMLVSAIASLIKEFMSEKREKKSSTRHIDTEKGQIIDVDYEEIK